MAQSTLSDLKGSLSRVLGQVAQAGPGDALRLVWAEAVGPMLSRRSRPVRLHQGVLTVEGDPDFLSDLQREQSALCRRLNERLGRDTVQRIHYLSKRL